MRNGFVRDEARHQRGNTPLHIVRTSGRLRWRLLSTFLGAALFASASACSESTAPDPIVPGVLDLSGPLPAASPAAANVDGNALDAARDVAESTDRIESLVVVRHGHVVHESYFAGDRASLRDLRSVTKSVVSLLTGIAMREGVFQSLDQPVVELLAGSGIALTPAQEAITVRHLLNMSSGFDWDESSTAAYNDWITSGTQLDYLLALPLIAEPGTDFTYNSAAVHLLGVVLAHAAGVTLPEFAETHLFGPLGIAAVDWEGPIQGGVNGGSGIDLRALDLAKLGVLMLQDGMSGGTAVLPSGWVDEVSRPAFTWRGTYGSISDMSYGGLFWTVDRVPGQDRAFMAWGHGGQFLYVVPDLDLAVVATTNWRGAPDSAALAQASFSLIVDEVLTAVR